MSGVDLNRAVRFDLGSGAVTAGDARAVIVPASVLASLPADARRSAGDTIGMAMGKSIAQRLGGPSGVLRASIEDVATQLAAEIALAGLGVALIERWGKALVVRVDGSIDSGADLIAGVVGGAMTSATGRPVATVILGESPVRVLVTSAGGATKMKDLLASGASYGDALSKLQGAS